MPLNCRARSPISSLRRVGARAVRSPPAMARAVPARLRRGSEIVRPMRKPGDHGHDEGAEAGQEDGVSHGPQRLLAEAERAGHFHPSQGCVRRAHGQRGGEDLARGRRAVPRRRRISRDVLEDEPSAPRGRDAAREDERCAQGKVAQERHQLARAQGAHPRGPARHGDDDGQRFAPFGGDLAAELGETRGDQPEEIVGKTRVTGVRDHGPRRVEDADPGVPEKRRGRGELFEGDPAPVRLEEALREVSDFPRVRPQVRALLPPDVALHDGQRKGSHQRDGQQDEQRVACREPPPDRLEHPDRYLLSECRRVRPCL